MADLALPGCTPEPLMNYLKALGAFRLVAEQADHKARLAWVGGIAHIDSALNRDDLVSFFLEKYQPTPILAPWNGGSGFYGGGSAPLDAIAKSGTGRLETYRHAIKRIRSFVPKEKPKGDEKDSLLIQCRSELADNIVPWLDVCFVLGEERPSFFPLLGTGGNDGRLDFTNNFMQRVADVIPFAVKATPSDDSKAFLSSALFSDTIVSLGKTAIGQFNPGGIGGANGTQGKFEADARVNPWDYVLMIEGALLFAGSVARRLGSYTASRAVFPFSVESVAVGYGSAAAAEETKDGSRAELWLPLWSDGVTLAEVRHLFAEGRAQLGRRQARNAVEFALAVNLLGVNRGIDSFARYGFLKRNGLAFLATPLGRIKVQLRPEARLLNDPLLVEWIDRLRSACRDKDKTPSRYQSVLRQVDRAMFAYANRSEQGNDCKYLLDVLIALGHAEQTLSTGHRFAQEKYIPPLQRLNPQWLEQANDGSPEFCLAAAVAGIQSERDSVGPFRTFLEEVEFNGNYVNWSPGNTSAVWSRRPVAANLAAVFNRRQMDAFRIGMNSVPLRSPRAAAIKNVVAFLDERIDDDKLGALIWALSTLNWAAIEPRPAERNGRDELNLPFEFGVPRLLVQPLPLIAVDSCWKFGATTEPTTPDPKVFHLIASGQREAVALGVDRAARRLKSGGRLVNGYQNRRQAGRSLALNSRLSADRLLASMLFPLTDYDLQRIANIVLNAPENED